MRVSSVCRISTSLVAPQKSFCNFPVLFAMRRRPRIRRGSLSTLQHVHVSTIFIGYVMQAEDICGLVLTGSKITDFTIVSPQRDYTLLFAWTSYAHYSYADTSVVCSLGVHPLFPFYTSCYRCGSERTRSPRC